MSQRKTKVINNCKVTSKHTGSTVFNILDPCNCSSYYTIIYEPGYSRTRNICFGNRLWNHVDNYCDFSVNVLNNKLCNVTTPWERCEKLTDENRRKIIQECIDEGFYMDWPGFHPASAGVGYEHLSRQTQLANVELAFASVVAGCVITLMIVAMVMEFCNFPHLSKKKRGKMKKFSVRNKSKPVTVSTTTAAEVAEGENTSVLYEDIEEEEGTLNSGFIPECPKPSVNTGQSQSTTMQQGSTQFSVRSQTIASQQRLQSEASAKPATMTWSSPHMVPKTKKTPLKNEKGAKVTKHQPQELTHTESSGYIHPV